jgi:hypothetical protein
MPGGRKQERTRSGPGYALAEFMNKNWDVMVGRPNDEIGQELGLAGGNMVSLWRTGVAKVSLERLVDIANLMHVDIAMLFPLWVEQHFGKDPAKFKGLMNTVFKRFSTLKEGPLLATLRRVNTERGVLDPVYEQDELRAIEAVLKDAKLRKDVLAKAEKAGVIGPTLVEAD